MMRADYVPLLIYFFVNYVQCSSNVTNCDETFSKKCLCGISMYYGKAMYTVNCTNTEFQNADMLKNLPEKTELLIFTGNNVSSLPMNIFGTIDTNYTKLKVIDMTNNNIRDIKGKTFHRVAYVERLILNHNSISLSSQHPRIFSNFHRLTELHLTDAFLENSSDNLMSELHNVFINSSLIHLEKIHLEQNEIVDFKDKRVFCDLPKLIHLYLGDNLLTGVNFDLNCLHGLNYLDLERNSIGHFTDAELKHFDELNERNNGLSLNLEYNPFDCDCKIYDFRKWISSTNVSILHKDQLTCSNSSIGRLLDVDLAKKLKTTCVPRADSDGIIGKYGSGNSLNYVIIILILILMGCLTFLIAKQTSDYCRRTTILVNKVHYSIIGNVNDPETHV